MTVRRILVTGAGGFIGRHVMAPLLARGFSVHAVSRTALPGATCHAVDLMDVAATRAVVDSVQPTHLLHLAWTVAPGGFWTTRDNLDWVGATLALYRAFVASGGTRFVGVGSCAEYDWSPDAVAAPLNEDAPCRPATLYGTAKDATRRLLTQAAGLDGVSFAWGRVFFLYGPGEKPGRLVSDTIARLARGEPIDTTAGTQRRDFLHVADVAGALAALADSAVAGPVNIASGEDRPLAEFLGEIGRQLGQPSLLRFGARPMPVNEPARLAASVLRLRDEVGFVPRFREASGIADTIAAAQPGG
jgi:nucleoside-diphosphate-sugar epimerase